MAAYQLGRGKDTAGAGNYARFKHIKFDITED